MSSKRTYFPIKTFPHEKLRVGGTNKNGATLSDFNTVAQTTKMESSPGNLEEYGIEWPEMKAESITYYIDPLGKNLMDPSLYIHPILHPRWSDVDDKSEVTHTISKTGTEVEEFANHFVKSLNRECLKIPENDRIWMMGDSPLAETPDEKTNFIEPIFNHPKYGANHPKAGRRDLDRSKTIDMAIWSKDKTKKKDGDKKKKYSNFKSSRTENNASPSKTEESHQRDDELMIPDTNTQLFIAFYDLTDQNKNRKRKAGEPRFGEHAVTYEEFRRFIYNANAHPNASNTKCDMMVRMKTLGPSINWKRNGTPGIAKFKVSEIRVTAFKVKSHSRALTPSELATQAEETRLRKAEFGMEDEEEITIESKVPLFATESERFNYEEQRACKRVLKELDERRESLNEQRMDDSLSPLKIKAIEKEISLIETKRKKKLQEQADLESELEAMKEEEGGGDMDDDEREDDSGTSQ